jgi:osmoprotectant transport system substrate-binding protein
MRLNRMLALGASLLVLASACSTGGGSTPTTGANPTPAAVTPAAATLAAPTPTASVEDKSQGAGPTPTASVEDKSPGGGGTKAPIKIGSVGFDEARVMAEIYAQALEAQGYTVDRSGIGLGERPVVAPAIESGKIDMQPEYIGSRLAFEKGTPTGDPKQNQTALQQALTPKAITVLDYTPAVDTNAFVVRADTATQLNLTKMSDLAAVQGQLKFGLATDCPTNALCGKPGGALQGTYKLSAQTIQNATLLAACSTPMANALKAKTIDVGELCSTQPDIIVNGWKVLEDDQHTQPADNIAPLVRDDYLAKVDKSSFEKILNDISAKIDTPTLGELYKEVAVDKKDLKDVAEKWLKDNGFHQ